MQPISHPHTIKSLIEDTLKTDHRLWYKQNGHQYLDQIRLIDLIYKTDKDIIQLLFKEPTLKKHFFVQIQTDSYVFKTNEFHFFIEEHKLFNSYTDYANRIGLADGKNFLNDTEDVVLNFPFKDCLLQGGQSTEEGVDIHFEKNKKGEHLEKKTKREEIFFNQILAKDEIDRLKDEKALVKWRRYSKGGSEGVKELKRDGMGLIRENMLIKGNNLLALYSLRRVFTGKIKLIYIDPPYNTGGDANIFTYNNRFNHSTWLVFMKNRLEVAKELLREDGFIAIAIDHCELFYLGTLADEIFGRENRIGIVTIVHNPKGRNLAKFFSENSEFMLVYSKNKHISSFRKIAINKEAIETFNLTDERGKYRLDNFMRIRHDSKRKNKPKFFYPIYVSKDLEDITLKKKEDYYKILPINSKNDEYTWKTLPSTFEERNEEGEYKAVRKNKDIFIFNKYREQEVIKNTWTEQKYQSEFHGTNLLKKLLGRNIFSYPKSLYTVLDVLKIMTSENDIILDFFTGSGTTGHATLSLNKEDGGNRKFILVEQLEKHVDICVERNQKVMQKEDIEDSFIYCELAKWNEKAKEEINACGSLEELEQLFDHLYDTYFLKYTLRIKEFKEKIMKDKDFKELSLEEHKSMFLRMLDLNHLYVCRSEMEDSRYSLECEDIALTKDFYSK